MASLIRGSAIALALSACGDLAGFTGDVPPLTTLHVVATGDFEAVRVPGSVDPSLHVALVWSEQWLPEALCFLPPESDEVAAVVAQGCRNPFSFTPHRVAASTAIVPNEPASLSLFELPSADDMVGTVDARIAYASLVVFDDVDRSGTLELARARRLETGGFEPEDMGEDRVARDIIYGASFVAMTEPDTRVAFREGAFTSTAFYPRSGCGEPLPAFSILSSGGFTAAEAVAATIAGRLPAQDPATCVELAPDATTVEIALRPGGEVREVGCEQRRSDSTVRYRQPPEEVSPPFLERTMACASIPSFGVEEPSDVIQLIVASEPDESCRGLTHYVLRGCDEGELDCDSPEWDFTLAPPAWWPCPAMATP